MADLAVKHGLTLGAVLAGTDLDARQLGDPEYLVSGEQELQLIRNLVNGLGDPPGLGIEAGQCYHFTAFGVLGFAIISSPTPRAALDVALQYFDLTFAFTRFKVEDHGTQTRVIVDDDGVPDDVRAFLVARDFSCFVTVMRDLFAFEPALGALQFAFAAPSDIGEYARFFRVRPQFSTPHTMAVLDRALFEQRMPLANELALHAAREQCRKLLDGRRARSGLASKVRELLAARAADMPDMDVAARELCLTARTLRRRLLEEETTFAELRDEVRQTLAEEFLGGPRMSIEQIAARLGYAEATSFINAFRRWSGHTPHAFRLSRRSA
nr:AraC family transcriptional regulator [Solimonas terrae]